MKRINRVAILLFICFLMGKGSVVEARPSPLEVEPAVYDNVKYTAPHFLESSNHKQLSGYIEAWDTRTNKKFWELKVYDIKYDPGLEKEAQEIYITSLRIEMGKLLVVNEAGDRYEVELGTKKVKKISGDRSQGSVIVK